jgi:hypothetical protein
MPVKWLRQERQRKRQMTQTIRTALDISQSTVARKAADQAPMKWIKKKLAMTLMNKQGKTLGRLVAITLVVTARVRALKKRRKPV